MKKAKIMLTAIALFAVVGGALAFKARIPKTFYSQTNVAGPCNIPTTLSATTVAGVTNTRLSVTPTLLPCPSTRTIFSE